MTTLFGKEMAAWFSEGQTPAAHAKAGGDSQDRQRAGGNMGRALPAQLRASLAPAHEDEKLTGYRPATAMPLRRRISARQWLG